MKRVTKPWSVEELALLKDMRGRVLRQDIAFLLGRTKASVSCMLDFLGQQDPCRKLRSRWTDDDQAFVVKNYRVLTNQQIADQLDRTLQAVRGCIRRLRVSGQAGPRRRWTEVEDTYFLLAWQTDSLSEIAAALGRTVRAVEGRAHAEHQITRSPRYYISIGRAHLLFPPELRELIALNAKLKKGIKDAQHSRPASNSVQRT